MTLEGIISKRADAHYSPGDRGLWVKAKCQNREEFVVVGWTDPEGSRPRLGASTKRALLIAMLERPEGASVAEIGQRLGWLPHTVRAAMTGLRHAGREVTRSKDAGGHSVYRLALVETADR